MRRGAQAAGERGQNTGAGRRKLSRCKSGGSVHPGLMDPGSRKDTGTFPHHRQDHTGGELPGVRHQMKPANSEGPEPQ